ncbi:MAG TPA: anti-sigma factor antagonist [Vicinamibacteria bacterium]|nr:anti-sigma factor antagonist [Vicinamibacteria bacterium]
MEIEVTPVGSTDVTLVRIRGSIVDGKPAAELRATLDKLSRERKVRNIIDLEGVSWFDSVGIGILVHHYVSVNGRGGKLLLMNANDKMRKLIEMVHLSDRFGWAENIDDALRWLEK